MSWLALDFAESAPVADVYERVILMKMAGRADRDGCGVWLSAGTMARSAVCDSQTVDRRLRAMQRRGLIALGDQSLAAKIPANRRPKVYDLMIPASFYSPKQLAEVNRERDERGLPPLTGETRPDIDEPTPSRKARSDLGQRRPKSQAVANDDQPLTWDDPQGGLVDPPDDPAGVSTRPGQGGLVDTARGVYETPKPVSRNRSEETSGGETPEEPPERTVPGDEAPPPPTVFVLDDRSTWMCKQHRAAGLQPDDPKPACGACADTRRWAERQLADRARTEAERAAADAAVAAEREVGCTWHDEAGWVVDPATGAPFEHPAVHCDHTTTSPETVQAAIDARRQAAAPSSTEEGRARARAIARQKRLSGPETSAPAPGVTPPSATARKRPVRAAGRVGGGAQHRSPTLEPAAAT